MSQFDDVTRTSADDRRSDLTSIALDHFAIGGYHGTSTETIAREAGISQPYLFRLFGTKRELFLACCDLSFSRLARAFERAAGAVELSDALGAVSHAYLELLRDRHELLFQLQCFAACTDPIIQARVREHYANIVQRVRQLTGATASEAWRLFGAGTLLSVVASLDLESIADRSAWAASWSDPAALMADAA